jgi:hypothetical protein
MVDEDVVTGSATDKTVALFIVKPLYCALFFHIFLFKLPILQWQVDHLSCSALLRYPAEKHRSIQSLLGH